MFAKLRGMVDELGEDHLVLDVGGVGYLVQASARTLAGLETGAAASLLVETQVGQDHIRLIGFGSAEEQRWFRLLQGVQGVGARVALAILSALDADALAQAIAAQDKAMVGRANGVGPKLAQRIVTELKDKAAASHPVAAGPGRSGSGGARADATSALVNLGYRPGDAAAAVAAVSGQLGDGASFDGLVRAALKALGPRT